MGNRLSSSRNNRDEREHIPMSRRKKYLLGAAFLASVAIIAGGCAVASAPALALGAATVATVYWVKVGLLATGSLGAVTTFGAMVIESTHTEPVQRQATVQNSSATDQGEDQQVDEQQVDEQQVDEQQDDEQQVDDQPIRLNSMVQYQAEQASNRNLECKSDSERNRQTQALSNPEVCTVDQGAHSNIASHFIGNATS